MLPHFAPGITFARVRTLFFGLLFALLLVACNATPSLSFVGTDISGTQFGKPLSLTDHLGQRRQFQDFKNKVVVLFFGYTHCPDVCPGTLQALKHTMQLLGPDADKVQVLFVTADPERDTQTVLAQFVPSFDKRFIGLRGSVAEITATMAAYKVYGAKVSEPGNPDYSIDHSAGMYVFDQTGAPRIYLGYGQKPVDIAHDIRLLLNAP